MPLDRDQYKRIIELLIPIVNTSEADRKALIRRAFYGEPVVEQLVYSGPAPTFADECIEKLKIYNREAAVIQLLKHLCDHEVGDDVAREIADIIAALTDPTPTPADPAETPTLTLESHLFISYARKDLTFVNRLRADLKARGIHYWIDREGLTPGTGNWERAIRAAIRDSSAVLWVVSPAAYESEYVSSEIAVAEMHKRKIYPVWADGDNWIACVPLGRHRIQYADMRGDAYAAGLGELLAALGKPGSGMIVPPETPSDKSAADLPPRNPYKGLHVFTEDDRQDFFGREALVRSLTARLETQLVEGKDRFLAVLGPSGAGKSSVVMAGLIPALRGGGIAGSEGWRYLPTIRPGAHPMESIATAVATLTPSADPSTVLTRLYTMGLDYLNTVLEMLPAPQVVVYIDQFEELFTLTESSTARERFISLLTGAAGEPNGKLIVVVSMRADFLEYPLSYPQLGSLFNRYTELVQPMSIPELRDAIEKPARRANLTFDDGLVADIVFALRGQDKALAGALPLLQFTLERLYEERDERRLTRAAYERMGGIVGAIGTHSEAVFTALPETAQAKLGQVFLPLVNIDENTGEPTRRRAPLELITVDTDAKALVDAFVENGLLQRGRDGDNRYLEVAHEALFRSWNRLVEWIASVREDLILLRQVRTAAHDWQTKREREPGKDFDYLRWPAERLTLVYAMIERLQPELNEVEQDFIEPEQYRLYRELGYDVHPAEGGLVDVTPAAQIAATPHQRRYTIGTRLHDIGDIRRGVGVSNGLPDVLWLPVAGSTGKHRFEFGEFEVRPFFIAKYLITVSQLQTFLNSDWDNPRWWDRFPKVYKPQRFANVRNGSSQAPRDSISWYQAVAFGRWMTEQFKGLELTHPSGQILRVGETAQIRLPTEWEWQWAAMNGTEEREYSWGDWDEHARANTTEAGIQNRSTAVGMYPHGAAKCGALDMSGNVWEWCLNDHGNPEIIDGYGNESTKVLRGGSFPFNQDDAASSYRSLFNHPNLDANSYGLRLVLSPPIASLISGTLDSEALKLPAAQPPSKGGVGGIPPQGSPRQRSQLLDVFRRRK